MLHLRRALHRSSVAVPSASLSASLRQPSLVGPHAPPSSVRVSPGCAPAVASSGLHSSAPLYGRRRVHPARAARDARRSTAAAASAAGPPSPDALAARASLLARADLVLASVAAMTAAGAPPPTSSSPIPASLPATSPASVLLTPPPAPLPRILAGYVQRADALVVRVLRFAYPGKAVCIAVPQAEIDSLTHAHASTLSSAAEADAAHVFSLLPPAVKASVRTDDELRQSSRADSHSLSAPHSSSSGGGVGSEARDTAHGPAPPDEGLTVFSSRLCPGDLAVVTVTRAAPSFVEASPVAVLVPAPTGEDGAGTGAGLVPARYPLIPAHAPAPAPAPGGGSSPTDSSVCGSFGRCSGCSYWHVTRSTELAAKRGHVVDTLERIGRFRPPRAPRNSPAVSIPPQLPPLSASPASVAALVGPTLTGALSDGFRRRARLHALTVTVDHGHARRYALLEQALAEQFALQKRHGHHNQHLQWHDQGTLPPVRGALPALEAILDDCGVPAPVASSLARDYDAGVSSVLAVGHFAHAGGDTAAAAAAAAGYCGPSNGLRVLPGGGTLVPPHFKSGRMGCAVLSPSLNAALALLPTGTVADRDTLAASVATAAEEAEARLGVRVGIASSLRAGGLPSAAGSQRGGGFGARGRGGGRGGAAGTRGGGRRARDAQPDDDEEDGGAVSDVEELWNPLPARGSSGKGAHHSAAQSVASGASKGRPLTVTVPLPQLLSSLLLSPSLAKLGLAAAVAAPARAPASHGHAHSQSHGNARGGGKQYVDRFHDRGRRGGAPLSSYDPRSHRMPSAAAAAAAAEAMASAESESFPGNDEGGDGKGVMNGPWVADEAAEAACVAAEELVYAAAASEGAPHTAAAAVVQALRSSVAASVAAASRTRSPRSFALSPAVVAEALAAARAASPALFSTAPVLHTGVYLRRAELSLAETGLAPGNPGAARVGAWAAPLEAFFQTNVPALPSLLAAARARVKDAAADAETAAASAAAAGALAGLGLASGKRVFKRHVIDLHCGVGLFSLGLSLPQRTLRRSLALPDPPAGSAAAEAETAAAGGAWTVDSFVGVELSSLAVQAAAANADELENVAVDAAADAAAAAEEGVADAEAAADAVAAEPEPQGIPLPERGVFMAAPAAAALKRLCDPALRRPSGPLGGPLTPFGQGGACDDDSFPPRDGAAAAADARLQWDPRTTTIIVDPPRSGLDAGTVASLREAGVQQILYVSCELATLARDLALLCDPAGGEGAQAVVDAAAALDSPPSAEVNDDDDTLPVAGAPPKAARAAPVGSERRAVYKLVHVEPLDMFPRGGGVEAIVDLRRVA